MSDISFPKCYELFQRSDRVGSSLKTCVASLVSIMETYSRKLPHTWKAKATKYGRWLFQLQPSMHRTGGTGSGSLPTLLRTPDANMDRGDLTQENLKRRERLGLPLTLNSQLQTIQMIPSPTASDATIGQIISKNDTFKTTSGLPRKVNQNGKDGSVGLGRLVQMLPTATNRDYKGRRQGRKRGFGQDINDVIAILPTPAARDHKGANSEAHLAKERGHHDQLPNAIVMVSTDQAGENIGSTLRLEPAFVEWMMGFPTDWTSLEAETTEPHD